MPSLDSNIEPVILTIGGTAVNVQKFIFADYQQLINAREHALLNILSFLNQLALSVNSRFDLQFFSFSSLDIRSYAFKSETRKIIIG